MSVPSLGARLREESGTETGPFTRSWDLTRILLAVAGIGGLIASTFYVLRPFLPAMVWSCMIVVATWPMLLALQARLWNRRSLAVTVMTLVMLAMLAAPLALGIIAIVDRADEVVEWTRSVMSSPLPDLPAWIVRLPLVGKKIAAEWETLARAPSQQVTSRVTDHVGDIARWVLAQAGSIGALLLQLLLTVALSALLYAHGESVAAGVAAFMRRLAGEEGVRVVVLSAGAIRAVALGIVVTAVVQATIGGIGLVVTGVPRAGILTCVMIMLGIAQIGPAPVLLGGVIWLYMSGHTSWAVVLIVWGVVTMSLDNVLRPLLIKRGADLPLLLIIAGVIGGLIAFGLVGLFVGPVILAVAYTLLVAWVRSDVAPPAAVARGSEP
jgi:predicted PurR-regulated permease PerM